MNIFKTKSGDRVIVQRPNPPILLALVAWVLSKITDGSLSEFLAVVAAALLIIWSTLEIIWGVNTWRRILGVVVLVWTASSFFMS